MCNLGNEIMSLPIDQTSKAFIYFYELDAHTSSSSSWLLFFCRLALAVAPIGACESSHLSKLRAS